MPGVCIVNAARFNWDQKLDFSALEQVATVSAGTADAPGDDSIAAQLAACEACTVVVTKEIPVTAGLIGRFPESVKLLVEAGTGYNNVDLQAARERGITVCYVPAYSQDAVAHLAITFLLNFSSSMLEQQRLIQSGDRTNGFSAPLRTPHFELGGKTIGLVGGTGSIGSRVSTIAQALGMKVLITSRNPPAQQDPSSMVEVIGSLDDLLRRSDIVSLHCPLCTETRGLINDEKLRLMKPSALLINTARGAIIDEAALITALENGIIAGAALDVQDPEPAQEALLCAPNVVVTPHIGWRRRETRQRLMDGIVRNVVAFFDGQPCNVVPN